MRTSDKNDLISRYPLSAAHYITMLEWITIYSSVKLHFHVRNVHFLCVNFSTFVPLPGNYQRRKSGLCWSDHGEGQSCIQLLLLHRVSRGFHFIILFIQGVHEILIFSLRVLNLLNLDSAIIQRHFCTGYYGRFYF